MNSIHISNKIIDSSEEASYGLLNDSFFYSFTDRVWSFSPPPSRPCDMFIAGPESVFRWSGYVVMVRNKRRIYTQFGKKNVESFCAIKTHKSVYLRHYARFSMSELLWGALEKISIYFDSFFLSSSQLNGFPDSRHSTYISKRPKIAELPSALSTDVLWKNCVQTPQRHQSAVVDDCQCAWNGTTTQKRK